jgi:dTDP-4-dehydrorhamnose reductase
MVHISTDYVFNGQGEKPWKESDGPDPVNAYGRSKLEGEKLFQQAGSPGWIVRTSWLYGPEGKHFVRTLAGLMRTREKVSVVDDQTGGPTLTLDLARFLLFLAGKQPARGIYHYANEGTVTWYGFTKGIQEELGFQTCVVEPVTSDKFPRPAKRPSNSRFDLSKARSVFPEGMRPWREALREYLAIEPL